MEEKELTKRESMRNLTLSTLEKTLIQNTLGANLASDVAKYGTQGKENSKQIFNSDEIKKAKEEQYGKLSKQYESLGVVGEPSYPSNSDISYQIIQGFEQVIANSYLEDLVEGVNKFVPKLGFILPDKFKGYVYNELIQKALTEKEELDFEKLNEDEEVALGIYENLKEAYKLTAAKKVIDSNYLGNTKVFLDSIMEKYNPQKSKEGK